jgi:enamine deaminase RidA (YjgF/YER057c/UK114 family)
LLAETGASLADVIRTRIYLTDMRNLEAVGAVHGDVFGNIRPATSILEIKALAADDLLVEIEADAFVE